MGINTAHFHQVRNPMSDYSGLTAALSAKMSKGPSLLSTASLWDGLRLAKISITQEGIITTGRKSSNLDSVCENDKL